MPKARTRVSRTHRRRRPHAPPPPTYAAIDLGTNNCRLLVARPSDDGFTVIDGFSRIVRLGEGLADSGRLGEAAIGRTVDALKVCAAKIRERGAGRVRCIATEACRRADNGDTFLDTVKQETGLAFETVSAETEAELTLCGCAPLLKTGHKHALLFDIGGGSTEVMWIDARNLHRPQALGVLSLPLGVVSLAERYGCGVMPEAVHREIVSVIDAGLAPFCAEHGIRSAIDGDHVQMIGTSGTVTTLGALYLGLPRYQRNRVDGLSIRFDSIRAMAAKLSGLDHEARQKLPCIGKERADLMLMGCAVLSAICERWPVGCLRAADRGIREGLLMGMIDADRKGGPRLVAV